MASGIISKLGWEVNCYMNSDTGTISLIVKVTNIDIENILKKALESGASLHWCSDYSMKYGEIKLYSVDGRVYRLNKQKLLIGLQQAMPYLSNVINGDHLDTSILSCDDADVILQLAIFNELLYD